MVMFAPWRFKLREAQVALEQGRLEEASRIAAEPQLKQYLPVQQLLGQIAEQRARRALELAEQSGARALAENVRSELYATGARPRTTALDGVESLTERELRVATLAADGQTNRDIAQALYVTPKTVEVHLTNAYRKLNIASRRELPAALTPA